MTIKQSLISSLFVGATTFCSAGNLSYQDAAEIARQYVNIEEPQFSPASRANAPANSPYYIFNDKTHGDGFVIISGRDDINPVIGYSDTGNLDENNMPDALRYLLKSLQSNSNSSSKRSIVKNMATPVIAPLIKTRWYQLEPYNCKLESKKFLTCCVATAMAQVMNYHQWPEKGFGQVSYDSFIPAYGKDTEGAGLMEADFSQSVYDWNNMLDTYINGNWTQTQADAVGLLMRDCGYAAWAQYTTTESLAYDMDMAMAMSENFGYDAMIHPHFSNITTDEWLSGIKKELDGGFPVIITGQATIFGNGGHCFVADGYDSNDFIHINWGWNGDADGYYDICMLTPYHNGQANHSYMQYYTSLHPRKPFASKPFNPFLTMLWDIKNKSIDHSGLTLLNSNKMITEENPAKIRIDGLCYVSSKSFKGEFSLWIADENGVPLKKIWHEGVDRPVLSKEHEGQDINITSIEILATSFDELPDGKYKLLPMSTYEDMPMQQVPVYGYKSFLNVDIKDGYATLSNVAKPSTNLKVTKLFEVPEEIKLFSAVDTEITVANDGDFFEGGTVDISAYPLDGGKPVQLFYNNFTVYEHRSLTIPINLCFLPSNSRGEAALQPSENYEIRLTMTDTNNAPIDLDFIEFPKVKCTYDPTLKPEIKITSLSLEDENGKSVDIENAEINPDLCYTLEIDYEPAKEGIAPEKIDILCNVERVMNPSKDKADVKGSIKFELYFPFAMDMPEETYLNLYYGDFITGEPVFFKPDNLSRIKLKNTQFSSVTELEKDKNVYETARYNAQGIRLSSPVPGINIVVYSNGNIVKEIVNGR